MDTFFIDWRNESAAQWWLDEVIGDFIRSPVLDTFYWDDPSFGGEHESILTNFTQAEIADISYAMQRTHRKAEALIANSGTKWSLGMMAGLLSGPACRPVPCGTAGAIDCGACDRGWNPGMNCSCTHPGTSAATAECLSRLEKSAATKVPARLTVPFVSRADYSPITCVGGLAGVAMNATAQGSFVELSCLPGSGTISIDFASFGLPTVNSTGRFIRPNGPSNNAYWEDTSTTPSTAYEVVANNECTLCTHQEPLCPVITVDSTYMMGVSVSDQPFSCGVLHHCGAFAVNASCDGGHSVLARVKALCDGKQYCKVDTGQFALPSGCPSSLAVPLRLAIKASGCTQGTAYAGFREKLASFLITRGTHSWMGNDWIAGNRPTWYQEWDVDYGEPLGEMVVHGTVASRQWSKMRVSFDCETFEANFTRRTPVK